MAIKFSLLDLCVCLDMSRMQWQIFHKIIFCYDNEYLISKIVHFIFWKYIKITREDDVID